MLWLTRAELNILACEGETVLAVIVPTRAVLEIIACDVEAVLAVVRSREVLATIASDVEELICYAKL